MKSWILLFCATAHVCCSAQTTPGPFADTVFIYKGFSMGGSTASLWFFSRYVDTVRNVVKSQLPAPYLDTLNFLMGQVRSSRHFQQKIGPSYYAVVIKDG